MANGVNAPFGLRPVSSISGGSWTEKINQYFIFGAANGLTSYGTSIFTGDPVIWNTVAATTIAGYPTIAFYPIDTATVNNENTPTLGVFMGCKYYDVNRNLIQSKAWPQNTAIYPGTQIEAYIIDDPDVVFEIQASTATNVANDARFGGTTNTSATASYFGQNYAYGLAAGGANLNPNNPVSGSFGSGLSAIYLNIVGTTATNRINVTLPMKAIAYGTDPTNVIYAADGTTANQFLNIRVVINNHTYRAGVAGVTPA